MFRYVFCFLFALLLSAPAITAQDSDAQRAFDESKRTTLVNWVRSNNKKLNVDSSTRIVDAVMFHAKQNELDPFLIFSMIRAESAYKPDAKSFAGARGLMQVMPRWHKDKLAGRDPYRIPVNIEVGTIIINDCLRKTKNQIHKALRCYSGGAGSHYNRRIASTHKELMEQHRALAILHDNQNATKYVFEKPKDFLIKPSNDTLLAFMHKKRPGAF